MLLKLSTNRNLSILMIDSANHINGKTGLSAGLTIYATKDGGTPAVITPTVTELDSTNVPGLYNLALTTTHTNTLGELQLHITASGADPTDVAHQVVTDLPGIAQTGDSFARIGSNGAGLTALGDTRIANLDATVSSRLATAGYTAPPSAAANATELLDQAAGVETNRTIRQAMRLMLAALAAKINGAGTATVNIRDTNDTVNRIVATVDEDGNRTAITYNMT